jgi:uncharacterized membrane protein YphA (DoxX/SURF4 family)
LESTIFLVGRLLLGGYFVFNAFNHFSNVAMMTGYAQSKGVPAAKAAVLFSGLLLLVGGLSILLGVYPMIGTLAIALFLLTVTFMMHAFWKVQDPMARMGEMVNFTKNLALLGGTLMLLAIPQPWSLSLT